MLSADFDFGISSFGVGAAKIPFRAAPVFEFLVDWESRGIRIDSFLSRHLRNYTTWKLQRMVRAGCASINECVAEPTDRVFAGQQIRVRLIEPPDKLLDPEPIPVPVLYSDPWMLVVNKPAGLIAHPTGEIKRFTLANALQDWLDQRSPARGLLRPGIVHRLDRQTSGLMAIAITHQAHARLAAAFEYGRVSKTYVALVQGRVDQDSGLIDAPIGRAPTARHVLMTCRGEALDQKPAKTRYEVLERFAQATLVRCRPLTGRNHQIRVHFAHLGHPLIGDEFYLAHGQFLPFHGDDDDFDTTEHPRAVNTGLPLQRHALHAAQLELAHPIGDCWLTFQSPLPEDFEASICQLRESMTANPR